MPASEPQTPPQVSMRDLLASCAAATTVSTPPRVPEPQHPQAPRTEHPEAA
ncbi:hypothetical protein [Streptomyces poriticola]|uniref:hypothetical protein n=1 Tax=Streptomyces poriticola TaxID=3120506 RepID=UPI002FCE226D